MSIPPSHCSPGSSHHHISPVSVGGDMVLVGDTDVGQDEQVAIVRGGNGDVEVVMVMLRWRW